MEKLILDTGVKEFEINDNGVLRFNPSDPNVYARFCEVKDRVAEIDNQLQDRLSRAEDPDMSEEEKTEEAIKACDAVDKEIKSLLSYVFGEENDFDVLLGGVSVLAITSTGNMLIEELLAALSPIVEDGAKNCLKQKASIAVAQAEQNRAQRRARK